MEDNKSKFKFKKLIKKLSKYRARHTELITVYVPADYSLDLINHQLQDEYGTSENIKSKSTRKNVQAALKKMLQQLKIYKKTPPNGLALFCGNVAENTGVQDFEIWAIEPPHPLDLKLYKCDQIFHLDPLRKMLEPRKVYGLILIDKQGGTLGLLKGSNIETVFDDTSLVPGKTRKGGQCLAPDTLVQSESGNILSLRDLTKNSKILGADIKKFNTCSTKTIDKWKTPKENKYTIITKNPRQKIVCSKDHLFFTYNSGIKEKAAEKLNKNEILLMPEKIKVKSKIQKLKSINFAYYSVSKEGGRLIKQKRLQKNLFQKELAKEIGVTQTEISLIELSKRNVNLEILKKISKKLDIDSKIFIKKYCKACKKAKLPKTLTEDLAQIIGYLIGDGSLESTRINFHEANRETALKYQNKLKNLFSEYTALKFREDKNYYRIRTYSKEVVEFIKTNFPEVKKSLDSTIPKKILESKNKVLAKFLKGIFDAEGYVSSSRIAIGINNELLAKQIQTALLRLGIISSYLEYNNSRNPYSNNVRHTIEISDFKSIKYFKKEIGFSWTKNLKKIDILLKKGNNQNYTRQILSEGKEIRKIIEEYNMKVNNFPKVNKFFLNKRAMSKSIFKTSILNLIKNKNLLKKLYSEYNKQIIPVKIKEIIKENSPSEMIDISTKSGNFIANNLIVHNSAARYARVREGLEKDWFKNIAERAKKEFTDLKNLQGIILGGPGPAKEDFKKYLPTNLKEKVIATESTSYTSSQGLQELVEKAKGILAEEQITHEKEVVEEFFSVLRKTPNLAAYGKSEIERALKMSAVSLLLVSEDVEEDDVEEYIEQVDREGGKWEIISAGTREGVQLTNLGNFAAVLRFPIE